MIDRMEDGVAEAINNKVNIDGMVGNIESGATIWTLELARPRPTMSYWSRTRMGRQVCATKKLSDDMDDALGQRTSAKGLPQHPQPLESLHCLGHQYHLR